jgi:hypothetical protein
VSIFRNADVACPSCKTVVHFELVHSVNADRRPDLRQAILDRSFQREKCMACGFVFRMEPEFSYIDIKRGQYIAVWPVSRLDEAAALEEKSHAAFERSFGSQAPGEARAIGKKVTPRTVFGWAALNEKLIAAEAGIDDRILELAKLGAIRNLDQAPMDSGTEFRLVEVQPDAIMLGWIRTATDQLLDVVSLPRAALAEIEAAPDDWAALRDDIGSGLYVDYRKSLLAV